MLKAFVFQAAFELTFQIAWHFSLLMVCFTVTVIVCGKEVFVVKVKVLVGVD